MNATHQGIRLRHRLVGLLAAAAVVTALLPGTVAATADPSAGFDAAWTVTAADGQSRNDGRIAIGDDLRISLTAVDGTPVIACGISVTAAGGYMMQGPGNLVAGACVMTVRIPELPSPRERAQFPSDSPITDLCVQPYGLVFADAEARTLVSADELQPGGRTCGNNWTERKILDFPLDAGTARPFVSDPPMVSWNLADWGTDMQPLQFGTTWRLAPPAFVTGCDWYLNGSWVTVIRPEAPDGCAAWDVRIPGILPSTLPWEGGPGDWGVSIVLNYTSPSGSGVTISQHDVAFASSDGVFESSAPAVFPVELAHSRFVTEGEAWHPAFQVSGGTATACRLETYPSAVFNVDADADGVCTFDLPAMTEWEYHQYWVTAVLLGLPDAQPTFAGSITGIPIPEPPVIDAPTEGSNGDTEVGVDAGNGQGLVVDLEVVAAPVAPADTSMTTAGRPDLAAETVLCTDRAISGNLGAGSGGGIPHMDASCGLAPGDYVATAEMVDTAGVVTTSQRAFTVEVPRPRIAARTPTATTNVPRDIRPTVTFNMPVTGVSGTSFRLRDMGTGTYLSASVTYDPATRRATLRPASLLGIGRTYRAYLTSAIHSGSGTTLAATNWTFKVTTDGSRPTIIGRSPAKGATGVSRAVNLQVRFSERVRGVSAATIRLKNVTTGAYVPAVVTYDSALRRATINPSVSLRGLRRYAVFVTSGIKDIAGNAFVATNWTFTTR